MVSSKGAGHDGRGLAIEIRNFYRRTGLEVGKLVILGGGQVSHGFMAGKGMAGGIYIESDAFLI